MSYMHMFVRIRTKDLSLYNNNKTKKQQTNSKDNKIKERWNYHNKGSTPTGARNTLAPKI